MGERITTIENDDGAPVFVSSDQHFFHRNILKHCPDRPFTTIEEMNEGLIDRHNAVVPPHGRVVFAGDYAMGLRQEALDLRPLLNGEIILVPGNHDPMFSGHRKGREKARRAFEDAGFIVADELVEMTLHDEHGRPLRVRVCHFPPRADRVEVDHTGRDRYAEHRPAPDGRWLLHGHVHQNGGVDRKRRSINVGVDAPYANFAPMSEIQIARIIAGQD